MNGNNSLSRSQRLLALIQLLRQHRYPVAGHVLAETLNISLRTLYRDIATLQAQGANIQGESGLGYILRPGFMLPPLMFSEEEIEALVLGSRWVARRTDNQLSSAATHALAKISAVLPRDLQRRLESIGLFIGPVKTVHVNDQHEVLIRRAIRQECKLDMYYCDLQDTFSQRCIWPLALGFFEETRVMVAWCELRQDFRHFRTDRIKQLTIINEHFTPHRQILLKKWREINHIPEQP
jgi:predicted DNA-binding transcriptional regulator YafY